MITEKFIDELNKYFKKDPNAIQTLSANYVEVNEVLADDENLPVQRNKKNLIDAVSMVGIINGLLTSIGEEKIAAMYEDGTSKLVGFCKYKKTN